MAIYTSGTATAWGWEQLSSISSGGGDVVGLELQVNDQYPMRVLDLHSTYLLS